MLRLLAVGFSAFFPVFSFAFSLTPMTVSLEPSGKEATRSFVVDNNSNEKIAVQISMVERQMDLKGLEKFPEADDDFIVYPPQLILGPNEKRTVRVTWVGNPKPTKELAYRIIAEQLPVDTEKQEKPKGAVIRMLLKYQGALYITPKGVKPELSVQSAGLEPKLKPEKLAITIENKGLAHIVLKEPTLIVTPVSKAAAQVTSVKIYAADLNEINGQNVLASSKRKFLVNWPAHLPKGPVKVELETKD
jgi:fimbrial chaperone protein